MLHYIVLVEVNQDSILNFKEVHSFIVVKVLVYRNWKSFVGELPARFFGANRSTVQQFVDIQ